MTTFNPFDEVEETHNDDPTYWHRQAIVTAESIKNVEDSVFVVPDLIIKGHVTVVVGMANCGKTALLQHLVPEICSHMEVSYYNLDGSASDIKRHFLMFPDTPEHTLLSTDIQNVPASNLMREITQMTEGDANLSGRCFILDTMKKFTPMISKERVAHFLGVMRALSSKGATVVLLGHTNKYRDADGNLIFEGTQDLRSDVDNLIFLEYQKGDYTQKISTYPDKVRGTFSQRSWILDLDTREIRDTEFEDIKPEKGTQDVKPKVTKPRPMPENQLILKNLLLALWAKDSTTLLIDKKIVRDSWESLDNPNKGRWDHACTHLAKKGMISSLSGMRFIQLKANIFKD